MTTRERKERKIEKREEWASARETKANQAQLAGSRAIEGITFGQPILIGHHSEKVHRAAINRCQNAMTKSSEHSAMAQSHAAKAEGLRRQLDRSIFGDDADAVEKLEARIAGREQEREYNNRINKIIRRKPKNEITDEKVIELRGFLTKWSDHQIADLFTLDYCGRIGIPAYVNQNLGGNITTDRKRLNQLKARAERTASVAESEEDYVIETQNGWALITFKKKPGYEVRQELKSAGFRWRGGAWCGSAISLPESYK